jgi:hemolysin activation/secretion protein
LIADAEGSAHDIAQLGQLAARITQFYQDQGYSIARAILPAQPFSQGNVIIQVIEAKYDQVNSPTTAV